MTLASIGNCSGFAFSVTIVLQPRLARSFTLIHYQQFFEHPRKTFNSSPRNAHRIKMRANFPLNHVATSFTFYYPLTTETLHRCLPTLLHPALHTEAPILFSSTVPNTDLRSQVETSPPSPDFSTPCITVERSFSRNYPR